MKLRLCTWLLGVVLIVQAAASVTDAAASVASCRRKITSESQNYSLKRLVLFDKCLSRLLRCELGVEVEHLDPASCRVREQTKCRKILGPAPTSMMSKLVSRFDSKMLRYCGSLPFAAVVSAGPGGLGYSLDPECGSATDLSELGQCLRLRLERHVDTEFGANTLPRAGLLLDNIGVGDGYPNLPRPPTTDVLIAAVPPGSGVLLAPATIALPSGNALRLSGDDSTLSCTSGNDATLTVSVLALGSPCDLAANVLQKFTLEDPYDVSATVGPLAQDATYCLHLVDGPCDSNVGGIVDLP